MDKGYIYTITNKENGMQYVGQTNCPKRRWIEHKAIARNWNNQYKSYLYPAMNKHGVDNFVFTVVEEVDLQNLSEAEYKWIVKLNTWAPNGYNLTLSTYSLCGDKNPFYGKKHSDDTKNKISQALSGRKASDEEREMRRRINQGERNPFYGKHHTDVVKQRIKQACIDNGTYKKTSQRMKGNKIGQLRHYKKVQMIDEVTGQVLRVFKHATEAGEYLKSTAKTNAKHPSNIVTGVCNGHERVGGGYIWRYLEDE